MTPRAAEALAALSDEEREVLHLLRESVVIVRPVYSVTQLAAGFGGSKRAWMRACQLGEIEAEMTPRGYAITLAALLRFLRSRYNVTSPSKAALARREAKASRER